MTHTQIIKRALEAAGFVFLRGGWVKREAAPRLQDKIDKAVSEAAEQVQAVKARKVENENVDTTPDQFDGKEDRKAP